MLAPEEMDKLVVLRVNREFMKFIRHNNPDVVKCSFSEHPLTILSDKDNTEVKVEEAPRMGAIF